MMMQCPKAKECNPCRFPYHQEPHNKLTAGCRIGGYNGMVFDCPACIEVAEPAECKGCPANGNPVCDKIRNLPDKPHGQLYKLPDKETIKNPFDSTAGIRIDAEIFKAGVDAVYAQAKPVDIDELAKYINKTIFMIREPENQEAIKQAIEEYMEGR